MVTLTPDIKSEKNLHFVKDLDWNEVFDIWKGSEENLPRWVSHIKERGFSNWQDWRNHSIADLHSENLNWSLYDITDPLTTIPQFKGGPFRTWINKYYGSVERPSFAEIAKHPGVISSTLVKEIIEKFPKETVLIGLKSHGDIVIIDGMHRCAALAVAVQKNIPIDSQFKLILADYPEKDIPIMGHENSPAA